MNEVQARMKAHLDMMDTYTARYRRLMQDKVIDDYHYNCILSDMRASMDRLDELLATGSEPTA